MRSYLYTILPTVSTLVAKIVLFLCIVLLTPAFAAAATLSFVPAAGSFSVGSTITVSVVVGSNGTALNAVSGVVTFPKDVVEVVSISKNQSIVSLWVQEPSFSNAAGTINFEGIILNPGYTGVNGKVININLKVKSIGVAAFTFNAGSILANDGSGTEILSSRGVAQYQFITPPVEVVETIKNNDIASAFDTSKVKVNLTSTTNPPDGWSNKTSAHFNFTLPSDVGSMRLLVNDKPDSMPIVVYSPPVTSHTINDLNEGVSYLHVQYKDTNSWGEVLHYILKIDTAPPENFKVAPIDTDIFWFTADDAVSGVDYFEVTTDAGETIKIATTSPVYRVKGLRQGEHTFTAKAFDRAGNYVETSFTFSVPEAPVIEETGSNEKSMISNSNLLNQGTMAITILSVVIPFLALLILVCALLFLSWRSFGGFKKKIDKEIYEARLMVHKSFTLLKADLELDINTLEKASSKRKLTREELKILKRLQQNIEITEQLINKEVLDIENKAGL